MGSRGGQHARLVGWGGSRAWAVRARGARTCVRVSPLSREACVCARVLISKLTFFFIFQGDIFFSKYFIGFLLSSIAALITYICYACIYYHYDQLAIRSYSN